MQSHDCRIIEKFKVWLLGNLQEFKLCGSLFDLKSTLSSKFQTLDDLRDCFWFHWESTYLQQRLLSSIFCTLDSLWIHSGLSACLFILSATGSLPVTEITECLFTETASNYTNTETCLQMEGPIDPNLNC
jgi:hypothetical protein